MDRLWLTGITGVRNRAALGSVDLRAPGAGCDGPGAPVVTDQQEEGACVLHAIRTAYECARIRRRAHHPVPGTSSSSSSSSSFDPDEWFERARAHGRVTRPEDAGLTFAEAAAALADLGGFPIFPAPPGCIQDGGKCLRSSSSSSSAAAAAAPVSYTWARIGISADHLALVVAKLRVPVVLGFGVPKGSPAAAFLDAPDGTDMVLPHPSLSPFPSSSSGKKMHHAVILMGYDADADAFLAQNSWGPRWGTQGGYFWIPAPAADDPAFAIDAMILF